MWARLPALRSALVLRNAPETAGEFNVLRTALDLRLGLMRELCVGFAVESKSVLWPTELIAGV
jgi:hypothetical protein